MYGINTIFRIAAIFFWNSDAAAVAVALSSGPACFRKEGSFGIHSSSSSSSDAVSYDEDAD